MPYYEAIIETFDPLRLLPFELIPKVFSHLRIVDVWCLQSVSRSWETTLSSNISKAAALQRWDSTKEYAELDLGRRESLFRNHYLGKPISFLRQMIQIGTYHHEIFDYKKCFAMLKGHLFAHPVHATEDQRPTEFQVHDLSTLSTRIWSEERTDMSDGSNTDVVGVFLTDRLGGYMTQTALYVADFESKRYLLKKLTLTNIDSYLEKVAAFGQLVAVLGSKVADECRVESLIWIYDHSNGSTISWKVLRPNAFSTYLGIHINQDRLLIFCCRWAASEDPENNSALCVISLSLTGQLQWMKTFSYALNANEINNHQWNDCEVIDGNVLESGIEDVFIMRLSNDNRKDVLDLRHGTLVKHDYHPFAAYWKDTLYHVEQLSECRCEFNFCRRTSDDNHLQWKTCGMLGVIHAQGDRYRGRYETLISNYHIFVSNSHMVVVKEMGAWSYMYALTFDDEYRSGRRIGLWENDLDEDGNWSWKEVQNKDVKVVGHVRATVAS